MAWGLGFPALCHHGRALLQTAKWNPESTAKEKWTMWLFVHSKTIHWVPATAAAKSLQSCPTLCDPIDDQAPPSLGFSRQEHWSGLPFPSPMHESEKWKWSCSVMFDSSRPHGLQPTRLLRPWDFPGKRTGMGCHCLLQFKHRLPKFRTYAWPLFHCTPRAQIIAWPPKGPQKLTVEYAMHDCYARRFSVSIIHKTSKPSVPFLVVYNMKINLWDISPKKMVGGRVENILLWNKIYRKRYS